MKWQNELRQNTAGQKHSKSPNRHANQEAPKYSNLLNQYNTTTSNSYNQNSCNQTLIQNTTIQTASVINNNFQFKTNSATSDNYNFLSNNILILEKTIQKNQEARKITFNQIITNSHKLINVK